MSGNNEVEKTSQYLDNLSFDKALGVKIVEVIGADGVLKNPATEETIKETLQQYQTQELDDYTTASVSYVGLTKADGTWLCKKIDESGNFMTIRYANVSNNATKTTYALAWTDRTSLTYGYLNTLTF